MTTPKVIIKGTSKQKSEGMDECPLKKGLRFPVDSKQPKQPSPSETSHGVSKGLMMAKGPVTQGAVRRLLMH